MLRSLISVHHRRKQWVLERLQQQQGTGNDSTGNTQVVGGVLLVTGTSTVGTVGAVDSSAVGGSSTVHGTLLDSGSRGLLTGPHSGGGHTGGVVETAVLVGGLGVPALLGDGLGDLHVVGLVLGGNKGSGRGDGDNGSELHFW